jgi:predicted AAA+ superfamily ATPase
LSGPGAAVCFPVRTLPIVISIAESKPQKRLAFYESLRIIKHGTLRRFAVLFGARRVGKTTIMYQMIDTLICDGVSPKNIL